MFTHLHLLCVEEGWVCYNSSTVIVVTWVQMCAQTHCFHMEERAESDREALPPKRKSSHFILTMMAGIYRVLCMRYI